MIIRKLYWLKDVVLKDPQIITNFKKRTIHEIF
jgi:hypothetical protein